MEASSWTEEHVAKASSLPVLSWVVGLPRATWWAGLSLASPAFTLLPYSLCCCESYRRSLMAWKLQSPNYQTLTCACGDLDGSVCTQDDRPLHGRGGEAVHAAVAWGRIRLRAPAPGTGRQAALAPRPRLADPRTRVQASAPPGAGFCHACLAPQQSCRHRTENHAGADTLPWAFGWLWRQRSGRPGNPTCVPPASAC